MCRSLSSSTRRLTCAGVGQMGIVVPHMHRHQRCGGVHHPPGPLLGQLVGEPVVIPAAPKMKGGMGRCSSGLPVFHTHRSTPPYLQWGDGDQQGRAPQAGMAVQ